MVTIDDKHVDTVVKDQNSLNPFPLPLHSKLGCLSFITGSLNSGTTLIRGSGQEMIQFHLRNRRCGRNARNDFIRAKCTN